MASFHIDVAGCCRDLSHVWEHTLGSGHAPLALRADWQEQLKRCRAELGVRHVRFHGLLSAPMDTVICQNNELLYSLFNIDQIFDFLLSTGVKPFVELSFVPQALASGSTEVFHYAANVTPPADLRQWEHLIEKLARHWIERYGASEVRSWFFEVWNEPNMQSFWTGTQADYFELYRRTALTLKNVDADIQVGGPATAQNAWIEEFVAFCGREDVPTDFISTHQYPTDALGKPGDDTETQLSLAERDVLRRQIETVRRQIGEKPLYYTEWSSSSNPRDALHDQPYAAAFDAKAALDARHLVQGYSLWTFSDIFQENFMPTHEFQGGFGLLTLHGIAKPAYRAYQLLHRLGNTELMVEGEHATVNAWATHRDNEVVIFLTNHAFPRHDIKKETVEIVLKNAPSVQAAWIERVDDEHANARALWEMMGAPEQLGKRDVELLHEASALRPESIRWTQQADVHLSLTLPPHGVAALTVRFVGAQTAAKPEYCG